MERIIPQSVLGREQMEFIKEFIKFLMQRKKFWLLPIILIMLLFGILLITAQNSVVAPFIYTLF
mgnify:CR=1 FL=1